MEIKTYKPMVRVLTVITIVAIASAAYFYWQVKKISQNPQLATQNEIDTVVQEVGNLMMLPEGETPTLATVNDLTALRGQEFFVHAAVGDKVLIYKVASRAILYRPSTNKIIEVAPINLGNAPTNTSSQTPSQNQVQVTPSASTPTQKATSTSTKR